MELSDRWKAHRLSRVYMCSRCIRLAQLQIVQNFARIMRETCKPTMNRIVDPAFVVENAALSWAGETSAASL